MLLEKIPLGRTIEIFVDREDYRYRLVSKVEDTNEFRICVTAIASNGRFFEFLPTDRIRLVYRDQDSMWEGDYVQAGLAKLEDYLVHYFQIVDQGKSFNRRNAYRVQLLEEVLLKYYKIPEYPKKYYDIPMPPAELSLSEEEEQAWKERVSKPEFVKGMIKDVSENGVGIYCDTNFEIEDGIFFAIPSGYGNLEVKAEVVRKTKLQSGDKHYRYYYGCALVKSDRRLLRYIFDLQRELLKRQKEKEDEMEQKRRSSGFDKS